MFTPQKKLSLDENQKISQYINFDNLTLWLIRLACIFIIIFFSSLLLSIPILLSLIKSQYNYFSLGLKDLIKSFLELYLT